MVSRFVVLIILVAFTFPVKGQQSIPYAAGDMYAALEKLQVLGSALYIAAHPDDENTRLITYLAKGKKVETAYISLTRGDGGQNLIGTEIGTDLGIIRTQELLAARRTDGGQQFFTRANDFGYSKTPAETFNLWDRAQVLADLVWVIRKWQPDVLITRFAPERYNYPTHGHHTASAILAEEAFDLAADPDAFPEQLLYVDIWQPKRLYWNTSTWFFDRTGRSFSEGDYLKIEVGGYNTALGQSYGEIAGKSRSQHKSQGFGAAQTKGSIPEYFELVKGTPVEQDFFEDLDLSWSRVAGGERVGQLLHRAQVEFAVDNPAAILPYLTEAYAIIETLDPGRYVDKKKADLRDLIVGLSGLYVEATTNGYAYSPGDSVAIAISMVNRVGVDMTVDMIRWPLSGLDEIVDKPLENNTPVTITEGILLTPGYPFSAPYYLRQPMVSVGMYTVNDPTLRGLPTAPPDLSVNLQVSINNQPLALTVPVQHKWVDRVDGELFRQLEITPPVTLAFDEPVLAFTNGTPKTIQVRATAWQDNVSAEVAIILPEGWSQTSDEQRLTFTRKGEEQVVSILVTPPAESAVASIGAEAIVDGRRYGYSRVSIAYDHIPMQTYFPPAEAKVMNVSVATAGKQIGYIMGAGDAVPEHLSQIGYTVSPITAENISMLDLSQFEAILVGIRAYNTEEWLPAKRPILMDYVKTGGNVIVQYQTTWGLLSDEIGPYPFKIGRSRVTVEEAPIKFNNPKDPLLNWPNQLTAADFEGWVQERGLYFAESWADEYRTVFAASDPGEEPSAGMLLVADYGKGSFMYTGISFFRVLPGGAPGAYRLLANLISYKHD